MNRGRNSDLAPQQEGVECKSSKLVKIAPASKRF